MSSNKRLLSSIGARVQDLREKSGMTQSDLAKTMKVSRETLNHWESNAREIKATQVLNLAELFSVTCDYILRGITTENVEVHMQTGLSDEAIQQLKLVYDERLQGLFPPSIPNIALFSFMLSNKSFMTHFPNRLLDYCNERLEDDKNAARIGKPVKSEETDIASYRLSLLIQDLAENCYTDFYKSFFRIKERPQKSTRRKKMDISNDDKKEVL